MLGAGGVGKSTLTLQMVAGYFAEEYDPTIEDSYRKQVSVDGKVNLLEIIDTAGQEEYSILTDRTLADGQAFMLVYSVTSRPSFVAIKSFYSRVIRVKNALRESGRPPIVLVGNKEDLDEHRQVSYEEGDNLAKTWRVPFNETSAKLCKNVEKSFFDLIREYRTTNENTVNKEQPTEIKRERSRSFNTKEALLKGCLII